MTTTATQGATPRRRRTKPAPAIAQQGYACVRTLEPKQRRLVERALKVLEDNAIYREVWLSSSAAVKEYLALRMSHLEHEEFHFLWLDAQNQLIAAETMFRGTLTQASVYPREVLKSALQHNAAGCILAHNHPSGRPDPSSADMAVTATLKTALGSIDVKVLDHIIVAGQPSNCLSFAETGRL